MPNDHDKTDEGASVRLSRREMLAVSLSGLVTSPDAPALLEATPVATASAAATDFVPDRWWEYRGRHKPPPGTKMLTWASVDFDNRLELERFYFEIYCEEMCDITGDPEQDKHIDMFFAQWQQVRADNEAFFAQQQTESRA